MRWTKKDALRVRSILDHIAAKTDRGKTGIATQLGVSRQIVGNWYSRGRIPLAYHAGIIAAAKPEMTVTAAMLDPSIRSAAAHLNALPVQINEIERAAHE